MSLHLIDLGAPVLFVHIPKTGGTSIRHGRTLTSYQVYLHETVQPWPRDLPSVAFVRDPFERVESAWRDFRFVRPRTNLDFPDFLRWVADASPSRIANPAAPEHHAAPMVHPIHGLEHAGFVGQYERLQDDLNRFCDLHGLDRVGLPHLRSAGDAPEAPRTLETRALVERIYADDYEYLARMEAAA